MLSQISWPMGVAPEMGPWVSELGIQFGVCVGVLVGVAFSFLVVRIVLLQVRQFVEAEDARRGRGDYAPGGVYGSDADWPEEETWQCGRCGRPVSDVLDNCPWCEGG